MMGFRPSFFLFLLRVELPLAAAAEGEAICDDFCAAPTSFACCEPFMVAMWLTGSGRTGIDRRDAPREEGNETGDNDAGEEGEVVRGD